MGWLDRVSGFLFSHCNHRILPPVYPKRSSWRPAFADPATDKGETSPLPKCSLRPTLARAQPHTILSFFRDLLLGHTQHTHTHRFLSLSFSPHPLSLPLSESFARLSFILTDSKGATFPSRRSHARARSFSLGLALSPSSLSITTHTAWEKGCPPVQERPKKGFPARTAHEQTSLLAWPPRENPRVFVNTAVACDGYVYMCEYVCVCVYRYTIYI